jgi:hypothetical protein
MESIKPIVLLTLLFLLKDCNAATQNDELRMKAGFRKLLLCANSLRLYY